MSKRVISALLLLAAAPSIWACSGRLHIELVDAGVYALDHAAVVAAQPGLADCRSDDLMLTQRGHEVALRVSDGGDGRFDAGDRIEWLGQPLHGPESWFDAYSLENVYMLSAAPGAHARVADVNAAAATGGAALRRTLHLEEENLMIRLNQSQMKVWTEPDYWHWAKLTHVDAKPFDTKFDLPDLATTGSVTLRFTFRGLSEVIPNGKDVKPADHRVEVRMNDKAVGEFEWDGRAEVVRTLNLPASGFRAKDNQLGLHVPVRYPPWDAKNPAIDVVMFNRLEVDFPAGGDLDSNANALSAAATGAPFQLQHVGAAPVLFGNDGLRYVARAAGPSHWSFAPSKPNVVLQPLLEGHAHTPSLVRAVGTTDWRTPAQGYDYIVVSHRRLIDSVKPLVQFHRERGLKVALIDVDEVYDTFNDGIAHPQAIRDLVDHALKQWPDPKPRFLLLVGDSSFDIRHKKIDRLNLAKWADRELTGGAGFGDIPSTPYSDTPTDLPHRNLIPTWQYPSYDGQSASDNHFVTLGADALHPTIAVGRFPVVQPAEVKAIVDKTIGYLKTPLYGAWRRDAMFIADETDYFKSASDQIVDALGEAGFVADKVYASPEEKDNLAHQAAIKDGLNEGRLLVHFIGHGGRYIWRTGPPDLRKNHDLFGLEDVGNLNNDGRLPMILSMTCYSAPFDNPTEDSIGEKFLREPGHGAVAVFAASWRNSPSPQFSKSLIEELVKPGVTIGEAIVKAKAQNGDPTMVETYNLLGDPALVLERPGDALKLSKSEGAFGRQRIEVMVPRATFAGMVSADWLDPKGTVIASTRFAAMGPRFVVPAPDTAAGAQEVRVYAADAQHAYDAIGRLLLVPPPSAASAVPVQATVPPPATSTPATKEAVPAETDKAPPGDSKTADPGKRQHLSR